MQTLSKDELAMKFYDADSSAAAVVLCDYGYFNTRDFEFKRTLRIKILKKEGFNWANNVFPIGSRIDDVYIRGVTQNIEDDKIVSTKLKSGSIFKERVSESYYRIRVAMPAIKVGSVFDIEFTYPGLPVNWYFQWKIPVKLSSLTIPNHRNISFRKNFFGFEPLSKSSSDHWEAKDMPAFKVEPFVNSFENYITKMEFDILTISFPGYYYDNISTNWNEVAEYLSESRYFGVVLRTSGYLREESNALKSQYPELSEELLKKVYDQMKAFHWNSHKSLYVTKENISFVYDDRVGNSADINLALIQMLQRLGFNAKPVVLSTRENGMLSMAKPSINKLNYVIARVEFNNKEYLLDVTEKYAPFDLLPVRCLNWFGYQLDEKEGLQIDLQPQKKEQEMIFSTLKMNDDLTLDGNIKLSLKDYAALNFRNEYFGYSGEEDFLDHIIEEHPGLRINNYQVENLTDPYLPIKEEFKVTLNNQMEEVDDEIYLYPMVFDRLTRNPLQLENRRYPIDFAYKSSKTYIATISIPDDYQIVSVPKAALVKLPEDAANFTYQVTPMGQSIQMVFKVNINKAIILEDQYKILQEWYNQMLVKHAEPVVLKHI